MDAAAPLSLDLRGARDEVRRLLASCAERLEAREARIAEFCAAGAGSGEELAAAVAAHRADLDRVTVVSDGMERGAEAQRLELLRERAAAAKAAADADADATAEMRARIDGTRAAVRGCAAWGAADEMRYWYYMPAARLGSGGR